MKTKNKIYLDVAVQILLANSVNGNKVRYSVLVNLWKRTQMDKNVRSLRIARISSQPANNFDLTKQHLPIENTDNIHKRKTTKNVK